MGLYNVLAFGGLILAILFLILTIILFFVLNIPKVVGAVTGTTQKKAIERIKEGGYESKSKKDAIHKSNTGVIKVRETSTDVEAATGEQKAPEVNAAAMTGAAMAQAAMSQQAPKQKAPSYTGFASRGSRNGKASADDSEEATEILGANEMKYAVGDMEATEVLSGAAEENTSEAATDILPGHEWSSEENYDDDAATDVLTASEMMSGHAAAYDEDEEATDVLSRGSKTESEDAEGVTDVLRDEIGTNADVNVNENEEILGRYSPEETAVLRSVDAMGGSGPTPAEKRPEEPVIKVLYSETIVHTEETLS